jgi:triacylglycerol esterase/lipase EstA (alpha/beta hydrolase family)
MLGRSPMTTTAATPAGTTAGRARLGRPTGTAAGRKLGRRKATLLISLLCAVALVMPTATPATAATNYPIGGLGTAIINFITSPNAVAGANNWNCKPTAQHPYPVVLVPATGVNMGANWVALAPMLANAGYCVFSFNYGMTWLSLGRIGGLGDIRTSAGTMSTFVNKVLAYTGASKVDVVGHSQGGMMPNYYIKFLGGASKVHTTIGLSPSNHGTTLSGVVTLGSSLDILGFANALLWGFGVPGLQQQEAGSSFQRNLFSGGDTVAGPRYVVIQTKHDAVVTPYTNAFLSGSNTTNILLQDQCPNDTVGHIGMFTDGPALQNVMNQLGPNDPNFKPSCSNYGVFL